MMITTIMMMMIIIIIITIAWLQVWGIMLEVTNNLVTTLSYYQASSSKKTVSRPDLDLALRS